MAGTRERTLKINVVGDAKSLDATLGRSSSRMSKLGSVAGVAGGAVAAGLGFAVKSAMTFEKQMSSLGAVSDASAKQMEQFRKQAMKAGRDTAFSANEAAIAQTELAKGGLSVANIMGGGLKSTLSLAAAGELELGDAASITANAMNLFGLKGSESIKVADALATAANATTADVADFGMALKQGGAVAKSAGMSFQETVVALEALAASGVKNSDAGTSLKTALIQLIKPTQRQADAAAAANLQFIDQQGNMKSLGDISAMLRDRLGGMTAAQRTATLATLAGTDGVRTLTALYDAGPAKLEKWRKGVDNTGTAAEVARKKQDNLAGAVEQLKGSAETLGITVGTALIPELTKAAKVTTNFLNEMQDGTGAGGRFADRLEEIWQQAKPIVLWVGRAAKNIAEFASKHPQVAKLAGEVIALGLAVKALRFVSAATGFTGLLKVGRSVMRSLVGVFARQGAAAGVAAGTSAAGAEGLGSGAVNALIRKTGGASGRVFGKAFRAGVLIGIASLVPEITSKINSSLGAKKNAPTGFGEFLANRIFGIGGKADGGLIGGTGRGDTVPAMLEPGEFVIRRKVVEQFGPTFFAGLNGGMGAQQGQGRVPGYTSGGIIGRANSMDSMHLPYLWGGGHGGPINRGVDCSGAVSYALGVSPRVSGQFMSFGRPGPGSPNDTKIYANAEHVFAVFNGRGWGTSHENPGGGPGWLSYNSRPGFTIRHLEDSGSGGGSRGDAQESASKERLQAHLDANLDKLSGLRNRLAAVPAGKAHAGTRQALQAQIRGLVSSNRSLRTDIRHAPTSGDRTAAQERSGSRLVNKIIAPFAKDLAAATGGAVMLGTAIEDADTAYGQTERLFGQTDEDLGTAGGRAHRISELVALAAQKKKTLAAQRKRAALLKRAISTLEAELKKLRAARDKTRGAKRAKMNDRIQPIVSRLDDLKAELHTLGFAIKDTELDIGDLAKDARDVAGTPDTAPDAGPSAGERTDDLISLIDARERAGVIDPATAAAQRTQIRQAVLGGALGPLSERERLQIMGDLRDATQQAAQDMSELRQAVIDLKASVDQQNAISSSIVGVELATAQRVIGDMFSNQLGVRVANRGMLPGTGALSRL